MKPPFPASAEVQRVLLVAGGNQEAAGEVYRHLRERFPCAAIEVVLRKGAKWTGPEAPLAFDLRPHGRRHGQRARWLACGRHLRRRRYDLAVNLDPRLAFAMLAYASAAPVRVGVPPLSGGEPFDPYTGPWPREWRLTPQGRSSVPPSTPRSSEKSW